MAPLPKPNKTLRPTPVDARQIVKASIATASSHQPGADTLDDP
jgi:hypothetical protein